MRERGRVEAGGGPITPCGQLQPHTTEVERTGSVEGDTGSWVSRSHARAEGATWSMKGGNLTHPDAALPASPPSAMRGP